MAEHRIAIESDLGVEHHQLAIIGHCERVDLDLLGVGAEECIVQLGSDIRRLLRQITSQPQRGGDSAAVVRHQARRRIDVDRVDLLRRVMGDGFDVHAAFGGDDHRDAAGRAVDEQREVEFLRDVDAVGHVQAVHLLAGLTRLDRHQRVAEHLGRGMANLVLGLGEADAALCLGRQFLELALAAATSVDLRLHDI
ncbi:MAG: hypothetical protein K0S66_595 [Sphingomonas sp.]|nr:hypothetical protein [Sphingomonas sp.]